MIDQERNVLAPLTERRQPNREDVDSIVEVSSKTTGCDLGLEVATSGGDQSDIGSNGLAPSHTLELLLLQDTQELDLDFGRQLADLVQKERAVIGQLEATNPALKRSRERDSRHRARVRVPRAPNEA